ncbi:UNVERIFIED_CONTAM: Serine carboxypeptidase-like 18 [Sesamum latifolium]|uniref:Carboxypeptidase n=1 Tax=Sesamum latifolium TaxID=2727402 RepID=A0AAW2XKP4_9LAMI
MKIVQTREVLFLSDNTVQQSPRTTPHCFNGVALSQTIAISAVILCSINTVLPQHVVETLPGLPDKLPNKLETGYIIIDYANSKGGRTALKLNEYGWTKAANIIFIDQPAGAGYSYTKTLESSLTNDTTAARQTYDFLRKWFINHPKYLENPLYIFGESYGGILVPLVVNEICNGAEARDKPVLNMKVQSSKNLKNFSS